MERIVKRIREAINGPNSAGSSELPAANSQMPRVSRGDQTGCNSGQLDSGDGTGFDPVARVVEHGRALQVRKLMGEPQGPSNDVSDLIEIDAKASHAVGLHAVVLGLHARCPATAPALPKGSRRLSAR